ncbi:MAG: response regulator [Chloroflexota bacterium]
MLTIKELAAYMKMNQQTVYRLAQKGEIPGVKIGGSWRFKREIIDQWLTEEARPPQRRILVVDDDPLTCELFADVLASHGHRVVTVPSGPRALEEIRKDGFDLVFLDLILPGMNGVEVFKAIKDIDPQTAVIIVTAYPDDGLMQQAIQQGPLVALSKPVSPKVILDTLNLLQR